VGGGGGPNGIPFLSRDLSQKLSNATGGALGRQLRRKGAAFLWLHFARRGACHAGLPRRTLPSACPDGRRNTHGVLAALIRTCRVAVPIGALKI